MILFIPPDLIMSDILQTRPAAQHSTGQAPRIVSVSAIFKPIFSSMTMTTLSFMYSSATRLCKESI